MNIYTKLFLKEYVKDPYFDNSNLSLEWNLNLSKNKYYFVHREFDLPSLLYDSSSKSWYRNNKLHRYIYCAMMREELKITYVKKILPNCVPFICPSREWVIIKKHFINGIVTKQK